MLLAVFLGLLVWVWNWPENRTPQRLPATHTTTQPTDERS